MDIHNFPIDYAVTVTDERVRSLLRERSVEEELRPGPRAPEPQPSGHRKAGWILRVVLAEPLIVGVAGFLLGWLLFQRG